jgi:hypothetical protein
VYGTNLVSNIQPFQGFQYQLGIVTIIFNDQDIYIIHEIRSLLHAQRKTKTSMACFSGYGIARHIAQV